MLKIRNKRERRRVIAVLIFSVIAITFAAYVGYTEGGRMKAEETERVRQLQQL